MLSLRRSLVSIAAFSALTPASKDLIVFALGKKGYSQWELPAFDEDHICKSQTREWVSRESCHDQRNARGVFLAQ